MQWIRVTEQITCHHGRPREPQIYAASRGRLIQGGPLALGMGKGLTTSHHKDSPRIGRHSYTVVNLWVA